MQTVFFLLSKILWSLVQPDALLLYLLLLCCYLLYRNHLRVARYLLSLVVALLIVVAYLPLGEWLIAPLEHRFTTNPVLPAAVDGIITLGGALDPELSAYWQQPELNDSAERQIAFAALAHQYPAAKLLISGGNGHLINNELKEADYVPLFLQQLQIDTGRVVLERDSRNTYENAVNSKALVQPKPGEVWLLITSASHMPRAVGIFCQQQWPVVPWPVDHMTAPDTPTIDFDLSNHMRVLSYALHEWLGLFAYYVTGKTPALLPTQCSA